MEYHDDDAVVLEKCQFHHDYDTSFESSDAAYTGPFISRFLQYCMAQSASFGIACVHQAVQVNEGKDPPTLSF